jgi:hypothetical protein
MSVEVAALCFYTKIGGSKQHADCRMEQEARNQGE